jgi:uncharacterized membrane protein
MPEGNGVDLTSAAGFERPVSKHALTRKVIASAAMAATWRTVSKTMTYAMAAGSKAVVVGYQGDVAERAEAFDNVSHHRCAYADGLSSGEAPDPRR